jgi:hypothetical protein
MSNIPKIYFDGIVKRFQTEIDQINDLITHTGEKGDANEQIIRDILSKFLPKKYSIGSGIVIDKDGNNSKQMDIIIYDSLYQPSVFSQTSSVLFMVDSVYMTIEIKTLLDIQSMGEAINNVTSVKQLKFIESRIPYLDYDSDKNEMMPKYKMNSSPRGVILGLKSDTTNLDTYESWLSPMKGIDAKFHSDVIYSINTTFLHNYEDLRNKSKMEEFYYTLLDENKLPELEEVRVEGTVKLYKNPSDGQTYPVIKKDNTFHVVDPGRGFLNFLITMNRILSSKELLKTDIISPYIPEHYTKGWFEEEFSVETLNEKSMDHKSI